MPGCDCNLMICVLRTAVDAFSCFGFCLCLRLEEVVVDGRVYYTILFLACGQAVEEG